MRADLDQVQFRIGIKARVDEQYKEENGIRAPDREIPDIPFHRKPHTSGLSDKARDFSPGHDVWGALLREQDRLLGI